MERVSNEIRCNEDTDTVTKQVLNEYEGACIPTIAENKAKKKVHDLWRLRRKAMYEGHAGNRRKMVKNRN